MHAAQVDQTPTLGYPRQNGWKPNPQWLGVGFGQANRPAGQGNSGATATTDSTVVGNHLGTQLLGDAFTALTQYLGVSMYRVVNRCGRRIQCCLQCGQGEFIGSKGSCQRMLGQLLNDLGFTQQDPGLRAA